MHWSKVLIIVALALALAVPATAYKWEQLPDHSTNGLSVDVTYNWEEMYILGDDYLCTQTGPLTEITIWGSWAHDEPPMMDPHSVSFVIGIYSDIPASVNGYSMPGECLWVKEFQPGDFVVSYEDTEVKGWLSPPAAYWYPCCEIEYGYTFQLTEPETFVQQGTPSEPIVYWLVVQAAPLVEFDKSFGWLASEDHWNDDAAWAWGLHPIAGGWGELVYPMEHPYAGVSIDLAFRIDGDGGNEGEDWGDAPDPTYPTLAISNGASHLITIPTLLMGPAIDAEPDGLPDPAAMGDDFANIDDEDGVIFTTTLVAGGPAQVNIDMTSSTMGGFIDAWIDFGADGSWIEGGDQIFSGQWVAAGAVAMLNFNVPMSAVGGPTFARFRLSSMGGLPFDGPAFDGEVEDYMVEIEGMVEEWKWEQLPDLGETGIDVNCTEPFILADDFLCEAPGRLTNIGIWGSWLGDYIPFGEDPLGVRFTLSIHEDIPAWESPTGFSMPGEVLWICDFMPGEFFAEVWQDGIEEGWMDPPDGYMFPADWTCWFYTFDIPAERAFHQTGTPEEPIVYWLDVQAVPADIDALFGWKTTLDHWNDDAVFGMGMEPYMGPWDELIYPPMHEMVGQSIDLAFRLDMTYGTDVPDVAPMQHGLRQNVPNPFNPKTTIRYEVPAGGGHVTIEVYDVSGRLVTTLVDGLESEGEQSIMWDGTDANGEQMATGVYFYRMNAEGVESSKKMLLLK